MTKVLAVFFLAEDEITGNKSGMALKVPGRYPASTGEDVFPILLSSPFLLRVPIVLIAA